jgi:uncharacterized protein YggT (Ycf19 family)
MDVMRRGVRGGVGLIARVVTVVTAIIVGFIVVGILLFVLSANENNPIVSFISGVAEFFVGPFREIFQIDEEKTQVAVNWGIAAVVYLIVGRLIVGLLQRARPGKPAAE